MIIPQCGLVVGRWCSTSETRVRFPQLAELIFDEGNADIYFVDNIMGEADMMVIGRWWLKQSVCGDGRRLDRVSSGRKPPRWRF